MRVIEITNKYNCMNETKSMLVVHNWNWYIEQKRTDDFCWKRNVLEIELLLSLAAKNLINEIYPLLEQISHIMRSMCVAKLPKFGSYVSSHDRTGSSNAENMPSKLNSVLPHGTLNWKDVKYYWIEANQWNWKFVIKKREIKRLFDIEFHILNYAAWHAT